MPSGFATLSVTKIANITDGTSNTMMASELIKGNTGAGPPRVHVVGPLRLVHRATAPNSPLQDSMGNGGCAGLPNPPCNGGVTNPSSGQAMVYLAARSFHPGGVVSVFCDGSVKFLKNSININTYRAISTTQGSEVISSDAYN